nr:hypothetical protein [Erythrobacter colymbi]
MDYSAEIVLDNFAKLNPIYTSSTFQSGEAIESLPRHERIIAIAREGCIGFGKDSV